MLRIVSQEQTNFEPVLPLLKYLCSLSQGNEDRTLEWQEDEAAVQILLELELPDASARLDRYIIDCVDPDCRSYRTLCVWYCIARSVAHLYATE
jgi:hypothetical protein